MELPNHRRVRFLVRRFDLKFLAAVMVVAALPVVLYLVY